LSEAVNQKGPVAPPDPGCFHPVDCATSRDLPAPRVHRCPQGLFALLVLAAADRSLKRQLSLRRAQLLLPFPPAQELITGSQQELAWLLGLFSILQIAAEQSGSGERERLTVWSHSRPVSQQSSSARRFFLYPKRITLISVTEEN